MAEESLRENELGAEEGRAFARAFSQPAYEPDVAAYEVDPVRIALRESSDHAMAETIVCVDAAAPRLLGNVTH